VPGEVFIVTAPSGTGKTTLLKELLAGDPPLRFSISFTTRPPRPGEVPGKDYFFVTPEEFARLRDRGDLAEWVEQYGQGPEAGLSPGNLHLHPASQLGRVGAPA
jgi:guanylate kinase